MAILTFLRSHLSFLTFCDMVKRKILLSPSSSKSHRESGRVCQYDSQIRFTGSQYIRCCLLRTSRVQLSFGFSRIIIFLLVMSICLRPSSCGLNCANYNISCYHGTCTEVKSAVRNVNRTGTVECLCEDRWSGLACDVFSCSGRTLWVSSLLLQSVVSCLDVNLE